MYILQYIFKQMFINTLREINIQVLKGYNLELYSIVVRLIKRHLSHLKIMHHCMEIVEI